MTTLAPSNHHIQGDEDGLKRWRRLGSSTKKRNGLNDARCILWAISKFFFYSHFFFTTKCYIGYSTILKSWRGLGMWERAQTTPDMSFGPLVSFYFILFNIIIYNNNTKCSFPLYIYMLINVYCIYRFLNNTQLGESWKVMTRRKGPRWQAQMTLDILFGP